MQTPLTAVPIPARRRVAATLGLFAALFLAVGLVAATGGGTAAAPFFSAVALVVAVLLGLIAWGMFRSVRLELAEADLDRALGQAIAASGLGCSCEHEHDPNELHTAPAAGPGAACAHDGAGEACGHDCETCVLAALRPNAR